MKYLNMMSCLSFTLHILVKQNAASQMVDLLHWKLVLASFLPSSSLGKILDSTASLLQSTPQPSALSSPKHGNIRFSSFNLNL